jgi:hypothetical protein
MRDYARAGRLSVAALLVTVLAACSTAYQEAHGNPLLSSSSGYHEEKAAGELIKVTYKGNRTILMYQVEDYALYRCAEIAQREGSPYFALYQTLPDALQDRRSDRVRPTTLLGIPHAEVYIRLHTSPAPGLLSASEVSTRLAPSIIAGAR